MSSGGTTPAGDVSLIAQTGNSPSNSAAIGPFTLSGGTTSGSTLMLPGGSYTVTAHYAGNGSWAASDSTPGIPVTVGKESSLTEVRLATPNTAGLPVYNVTTVPYGSVYILRMDVTNGSAQTCVSPTTEVMAYPCPTGSLTVSPAPTEGNPPPGTVAGSYTLNSQGYAEDQPIQQSPGTYNFVANYAGDNSYTASASAIVPITIIPGPTTTSFVYTTPAWGILNFTASVATESNGAAPTGTVQFMNGTTPMTPAIQVIGSSATQNAFAKAGLWYQSLSTPPGVYNLTAQYSGDGNYASSTSPVVAVTVSDYSFAVNPSSINIPTPGQSGTATITLTPLFGFTGPVYLSCDAIVALGMTCTISPSTINLTGLSAQKSTVTITSTGSSIVSPLARRPTVPPGSRLPTSWFWLAAGLLVLLLILRLTPQGRRARMVMTASALMILAVWAACGGGSGGGGGGTTPSYPNASFAPINLSFGQQTMNTPSLQSGAILINTGSSALSISSITLTGPNASDFSQTNNCSVSNLAAGANCSFTVVFTPTASGSRSASISVTDYESGNGQQTQTLPLTGTGTQPLVGISPSSLNFGKQVQSTRSAPQTLTLTYISSAPVSFYPMSIEGGNYSDFNVVTDTCGINVPLAVGANCTVGVSLFAFDTGPLGSFLAVVINGSSAQQTVPLSGTGVLPATTPGNYSFLISANGNGDSHSATLPVTVQ